MAAKASEPTSWTTPSTVVSAFLYLNALYRMTAHRIMSMTELMIESTCEVPGATSKLCGPVPKNMTATTTVTAIIMPEPMSPTASRARSPRASSMPSAGTSGNRVRKYSSVIPSLPHAKTLQLFNVIAQLRSSGGRFSVNWGVLGIRGKESVRFGAEGQQEKCAPVGAPSCYSACLTRGLRPRGLSISASAPPSRYWRHQALTEDSLGILCLIMASRTVRPFSRRSLTTASFTSYE